MDIYEQCKTDAKQKNTTASKIDVVLSELSKKDAESLKKALLDENIPTRTIERVLRENGIECGQWAINHWRRTNKVKLYTSSMTKKEIAK